MENLDLLDNQFNPRKLDNNKDIAAANKVRMNINESTNAIQVGFYVLFALIGLQILSGFITYIQETIPTLDILIEVGFMIVLYLLALVLAWKKPRIGLISGLLIYILHILLYISIDPSQAYKGIIIKGFILFFLIKAIYHTFQIKEKIALLKTISFSEEEMNLIDKQKELPKIPYIKKK